MNSSRAALLLLSIVFLAQNAFYYSKLPERMATHFDASGNADGWMPKDAFLVFGLVLVLLVVGQFLILPVLLKKMPVSLINLPNKDYWMAPERREETVSILRSYFEWFGCALLLMFIVINQMAITANLSGARLSGASWLAIGGFIVFSVVWTIGLMRKFRKPF